jgi:hypothetical protein
MEFHINKDRLLTSFKFKENDFDTKTEQMIEDALISTSFAEFRSNYPESFNHFIEEIHISGEDLEESFDEFLGDLLIVEIFQNQDDEDDEY